LDNFLKNNDGEQIIQSKSDVNNYQYFTDVTLVDKTCS